MHRYLGRLIISLLFALTLSVTSKAQGIDVSMFKRVDWNSTQYQVKLKEKAQFVSDDVNSATHQPMLEYSTLLAGKTATLNYDFEGGFLSSITYNATFGFDESKRVIQHASLEKVLDFYININAELEALFGETCGCAYYGDYYIRNQLRLNEWVIYPKHVNCVRKGQMNKYNIYLLAEDAFQEDKDYCHNNKLEFKEEYEVFRFHTFYENNDNLFDLVIYYSPEENYLRKMSPPQEEALCKLVITPKRKDVICDDN